MRIASFLVVFVAAISCAVVGCGIATEPEVEVDGDLVSTSTPASVAASAYSYCQAKWTCDATGVYYAGKTQCIAACSVADCYRDYECNGHCICP